MKWTNENSVRWISLGLILMSFVIELNMLSFNDRTTVLTLLYGLFVLFYLFIVIRFRLRYPPLIIVLILFLAYLAFLAFFSSDRVISYNYFAKVAFGLLSFVTGYNFFYRRENLQLIARSSLVMLTTGLIIAYINNFRHAGISLYENDFYGQSLATTYNTFALLACVLLSLSFFYTRKEIIYSVILTFLSVFLLLLVFKRSPIMIIGLAVLSTLLFSAGLLKINFKMRRNLILLFLALTLTYPLYRDTLSHNFLVRESSFEAKLNEQARYVENIAVLNQIVDRPVTLFFGTGDVFNSRGKVIYRDRMLHTDYANILWSGGIVGFIAYFGIFIVLLRKFIKVKLSSGKHYLMNNISFAGIIMIQSYFVCALSQAWTSISVMSVIMLFCGSVYGFIRTHELSGVLHRPLSPPAQLMSEAERDKKKRV